MASKKSQFLGFVFEGAFKLGFLKEKIEDYENFAIRGVFNLIAYKYKDLEDLIPAWKNLEQKFFGGLENFKESGLKYTDENLLYFIFLVGYYEGLFFGKNFKNPRLIKYEIGEDSSEAGNYKNADLLFIEDNTLYVIDFKLGGAQHRAKYILDGAEEDIPFKTPGVPVNLSLGEISLVGFLNSVVDLEDRLIKLQEVNPEIKGFIQVLSYAVDYICEEYPEQVSEVSVSIFYPLAEPLSARFYWKGENLEHYREKFKVLYKKLKEISWIYSELEEPVVIRSERLMQETQEQIEELKKRIEELEKSSSPIYPDSMKLARKDVENRLKEFLAKEDRVKALCLFHSAGSGKTIQTRNAILNMEGKHIVLYTATRKVLLRREYEELSKMGIDVIYEERKSGNSNYVRNVGDEYHNITISPGILKRTVQKIKELIDEDKRIVWALFTQQAITNNQQDQSTSRHLKELASNRIVSEYMFHIILDEFLGYKNGLFVIGEMFEFLRSVKERGGKANLYLFDANGYSASLLKKLLEEYSEFKVMPDAIVLTEYKQSDGFEHNGIKVFVYAKHGYPSPEIILKRKFIFVDEFKEAVGPITEYIKNTIQKDNTSLVYVQHREMLSELKDKLEKEGFTTLIATAYSRQSQEKINKGNEDIILATSALSRGIDLSRPHKPVNQIYVVIHTWGIESNLVELIQTISRARGDEKTEESHKELHLIYLPFIHKDTVDHIIEYIDREIDKELVKRMHYRQMLEQILLLDGVVSQIIKQFVKNAEEGKRILVPIPSQHKTRYIPNQLSDVETLISFIESIYELTGEEKLVEIYNNLLKAIDVSAVGIDFRNPYSYYHPYILFEKQKVRSDFDEKLRRKIVGIFREIKNTLKNHNEEYTRLLENFITGTLPTTSNQMPVLIPVYSYVLTNHFLEKGRKMKFYISKRVGRGGAEIVMGGVRPSTYCYKGESLEDEYACIALGEEYPYKEILSGRFAKFPIEFLRRLSDE